MRTPSLLHVLSGRSALTAAFVGVFILTVIAACYKAPVTGRSQLILIPENQEIEMGLVAFQEVLKNQKISHNRTYNRAVGRVVARISRVSHRPNYDWEYRVIDNSDEINAFALPGGKVGIYTGIIPIAHTEAGLATVIGHEVAHATARHGGERITAGILAQMGAVALNIGLSNKDPAVVQALNVAYGLGITVGAILPFSRRQEAEADRIGLIYMAKAGYHPREALAFWDRMHEATRDKPRPPQFLATHPGYRTRRSNLQKWQPEAMQFYRLAPKAPNNLIAGSEDKPHSLSLASLPQNR